MSVVPQASWQLRCQNPVCSGSISRATSMCFERTIEKDENLSPTGCVFSPSPSDSAPPQPELKRGQNSVKVALLKGDLGGAPGLPADPSPQPLAPIFKTGKY